MKYEREYLKQKGIPHLPGDWDFRSEAQQVSWVAENYPNVFKSLFNLRSFIKLSELSRYITKGDRNGIRLNKEPKKHLESLDNFFHNELPQMWDELKSKLADKPKAGGAI